MLSVSRNACLSKFDAHLYATEDVRWRHKTCAVVSNSGEVLRRKLGAEIDEHDAVFRINYPPTENFEEYVGSKTTVELVNHHHARAGAPTVHPRTSSPRSEPRLNSSVFLSRSNAGDDQ